MVSIITGRKHFNVNKNMESSEGIYYSQVYARNRFSPELPILPRSPDQSQILILKRQIQEKEERLNELKQSIRVSPGPKFSPMYQELAVVSAYKEQCVEIYKDHYKHLEDQIHEKQRKRIDEVVDRQKELKERLQLMYQIRDAEAFERKKALEKAERYRKDLEVQQSFNSGYARSPIKSRSVTPRKDGSDVRMSYLKARSIFYSPEKVPMVQAGQVSSEAKNAYKVVADYTKLPAFQQPLYTKSNPKADQSYPVIGTRAELKPFPEKGYMEHSRANL